MGMGVTMIGTNLWGKTSWWRYVQYWLLINGKFGVSNCNLCTLSFLSIHFSHLSHPHPSYRTDCNFIMEFSYIKKILLEVSVKQKLSGVKSDKIEPNEAVLVSFEGRIADDRSIRNGQLFQKTKGWLIIVGDSDVVPALDMVRRTKRRFIIFIWWRRMIFL